VKLQLIKNISEMTETELHKFIKYMPYLSWAIFFMGVIMMAVPTLFTYLNIPVEPITFTLPHENFLPYEEAVYIVRVFSQLIGVAVGICIGFGLILLSKLMDIEVVRFKTELRFRKIEQKLGEGKT
jgi:hypothetical protein